MKQEAIGFRQWVVHGYSKKALLFFAKTGILDFANKRFRRTWQLYRSLAEG